MALLPPKPTAPISECNTSIEVKGMLSGKGVRLLAYGNKIAEGTASWSRQVFPLDPGVVLTPGDKITALQFDSNEESAPSSPPIVVQKKPTTVGQPVFNGPVYRCGRCLQVEGAAPGALVQVSVLGNLRGQAQAPTGTARLHLSQATNAAEILEAVQGVCGGPPGAKASAGTPLEPTPSKSLPTPVLKTPMACEETIRVSGVLVGAQVTIEREAGPSQVVCFDKPALYVIMNSPLKDGETITAWQELPACELTSKKAQAKVGPLVLPRPMIWGHLCVGSDSVWISNLVPGAQLLITLDSQELGWAQVPDTTQFAFPLPPMPQPSPNHVWELNAKQRLCGKDSEWAPNSATVFPASAAVPSAFSSPPLFACAGAVGVLADPLALYLRLESEMLGAPIAEGQAGPLTTSQTPFLTVLYPQPLLMEGDLITLVTTSCDGSETQVGPEKVVNAKRLSPPTLEAKQFTGQQSVKVKVAKPGAWVEVQVNGQWAGGAWLAQDHGQVSVSPLSLQTNDTIRARQRLCGAFSALSKPVTVVPKPPVAKFLAQPVSGTAPLTVSFTDQSSGVIDSWAWDRDGDGATDSTSKTPGPFQFLNPTTATVSLTVANLGGSDHAEQMISVSAPAPPDPGEPPPNLNGISQLYVYNCNTEYHPIHIWVYDLTSGGNWSDFGWLDSEYDSVYGYCPAANPLVIPLTNGHLYSVVFIDVQLLGCSEDNPLNQVCTRDDVAVLGDSNGPSGVYYVP
jgi:PKD repeat protein